MVTASATKEKGLFQVTKKSYDTWSCSPVVYGSVVRFKAMELSTADLNGLFRVFNLPLPETDTVDGSFIVEFVDDMPLERLSRFGFPSSEVSYAV
ncbi:MAG: hypothetical protein JST89_03620 [Cyanobacteria bacterium SZAS-4]|nr:hypothetical protein [Cyanobacteria bacterium SZAS-4]